ncbi:hypothetical protein ACRS5S_09135 [Nocardia asiatica]|uniref:hypothetical protein n=1 Tax=Nocardia asiatica TaxID=209252 RepID=UPI003EDEAF0C
MTSDPLADDGYRLVLDHKTSTAQVLRPGQPPVAVPLAGGSPFGGSSNISHTSYSPTKHLLTVKTTRGDQIVAEMPTVHDFAPYRGRPAVYLDQNHWNTLYRAKYVISGVRSPEREAALWLIEQASAGRIILPLSSAHMSETCKWRNGGERYTLALTMLQLSAGWQLRDPLAVRRNELLSSLHSRLETGGEISAHPVVTLEPYAISRDLRSPEVVQKHTPLVLAALTALTANFDTMLDGEATQQNPVTGWVERNQKFTDWLVTEKAVGSGLTRKRTFAFFFSDTTTEIAKAAHSAGLSPEEMSHWNRSFMEADVPTMPNLGLYREVFHDKLVDGRTRWTSNDLTDMMYLTCAAAYCDFTVGEKSLTSKIEQAQRRTKRPCTVYRQLSACVPAIAARIGEEFL